MEKITESQWILFQEIKWEGTLLELQVRWNINWSFDYSVVHDLQIILFRKNCRYLTPASEEWGKVIFSQVCVCLQGDWREVCPILPLPPLPSQDRNTPPSLPCPSLQGQGTPPLHPSLTRTGVSSSYTCLPLSPPHPSSHLSARTRMVVWHGRYASCVKAGGLSCFKKYNARRRVKDFFKFPNPVNNLYRQWTKSSAPKKQKNVFTKKSTRKCWCFQQVLLLCCTVLYCTDKWEISLRLMFSPKQIKVIFGFFSRWANLTDLWHLTEIK